MSKCQVMTNILWPSTLKNLNRQGDYGDFLYSTEQHESDNDIGLKNDIVTWDKGIS